MLCSICKNEQAVIFINEPTKEDPKHVTGYCLNCAREKGIKPLQSVLGDNDIDLKNVAEQFETMFNNISNNMDLSDIDFEEGTENMVPIGAIFGNIFNNQSENNQPENKNINSNKRTKVDKKTKDKKKKFLDMYGTNLTNKAKNNELDAVIGRNAEIRRIIQILNRRTKNNPCLIGEPGVGKTAIAQGLAICIANENVPAKLLNKEVYLLDMTSVVAGTQFRGQFEARMKGIIDECKSLKNIILVIDEIHNIVGTGDGENAMNAANILKPPLANGEIQLIRYYYLKRIQKIYRKRFSIRKKISNCNSR